MILHRLHGTYLLRSVVLLATSTLTWRAMVVEMGYSEKDTGAHLLGVMADNDKSATKKQGKLFWLSPNIIEQGQAIYRLEARGALAQSTV